MIKTLGRRLKIGLLAADFPKDQPFFSGVVAAARAYDANLFCIQGRLLHWRGDFEYQGNVMYDLVDVTQMDGLITWAGAGVALGYLANQDEMNAFFRKYAPLPIVNYEKPIAGLYSVQTDTAESMKEVLRHLLGIHRRQRVLLVRGPLNHYETEERVRAYRETLKEFGLPVKPELFLPPVNWMVDFDAVIGQSMEQSGLAPGRDFDSVACTENYLACAMIRVLQSKGFRVPEDVAVVGFNESPENLALHPPLTTVNKPFFASGYKAFEVLLDVIAHKKIPFQTLVPGELLLRSSCGCVSQAILEAAEQPAARQETLKPGEAGWIEGLKKDLEGAAGALAARLASGWVENLWTAFQSDLRFESEMAFAGALTGLMLTTQGGQDSLSWNRILSRFRSRIQPLLAAAEQQKAESTWQQGRICIQEFFQQEQLRQSVALRNQSRMLNQFAVALSAATDVQALMDVIARDLPGMGIPSCYLSLYADPTHPVSKARLILAYRDGKRINLPARGILFSSRQLVPEDLLPANRGYAMVVEPLYYQERQLGFVVQEYIGADENLYVFLQKQISSALDRLLIEQEVRESEERYHTLVDNLRELILVHREGKLLFANRAARVYNEGIGAEQTLLEIILKEPPRIIEKDLFPANEDGSYEIDILDANGIERRMIVRKQMVIYGHAPAEQIILIDITDRKRLEDHLYFISTHDVMTGVYNRAFFEQEIARQHSESEYPLSIIVVDVDNLKVVNDRLGHAAGDQMLRLSVSALHSAFRGEDVISRIGGDEFAVILPQMDQNGMKKSIERVHRHLDEINHEQKEFILSLSIGGVTAQAGEDLMEAFKQADQAMYSEKARRKNGK